MQSDVRQVLDIESTLQRLKGDMGFLHTLFRVFLDDLPDKIASLDKAICDNDRELIQRTAHSLKGACATIGADMLRDAAHLIEQSMDATRPEQHAAAISRLKVLAQELSLRLQQEIGD